MRDDARNNANNLLHHCTQAPPLSRMTKRAVGLDQGRLADGAQNIEGQHGQGQHQIVGGEFVRRRALQVEICVELGMKLLIGAVRLVQRDGLGDGQLEAGEPAFDLELGYQQHLAVAVDGALNQMRHSAHFPVWN